MWGVVRTGVFDGKREDVFSHGVDEVSEDDVFGALHGGDVEAGVAVLVGGVVVGAVQNELLDAVVMLILGGEVQSRSGSRVRYCKKGWKLR